MDEVAAWETPQAMQRDGHQGTGGKQEAWWPVLQDACGLTAGLEGQDLQHTSHSVAWLRQQQAQQRM